MPNVPSPQQIAMQQQRFAPGFFSAPFQPVTPPAFATRPSPRQQGTPQQSHQPRLHTGSQQGMPQQSLQPRPSTGSQQGMPQQSLQPRPSTGNQQGMPQQSPQTRPSTGSQQGMPQQSPQPSPALSASAVPFIPLQVCCICYYSSLLSSCFLSKRAREFGKIEQKKLEPLSILSFSYLK